MFKTASGTFKNTHLKCLQLSALDCFNSESGGMRQAPGMDYRLLEGPAATGMERRVGPESKPRQAGILNIIISQSVTFSRIALPGTRVQPSFDSPFR